MGGFFKRIVAVANLGGAPALGIKFSSNKTVVWEARLGYSKHKQHQTSHFINDWATSTVPEMNQNRIAIQLSNIIDDKRMELKSKDTVHVRIAGVSCVYVYRGIHIIPKLITKTTGKLHRG